MIEWVFNSSRGTYGYRRVHAALARRGVETSPDTVRSIMRSQGLEAAQPRRKVRTTVPAVRGYRTIHPTRELTLDEFRRNFESLDWQKDVKIKKRS